MPDTDHESTHPGLSLYGLNEELSNRTRVISSHRGDNGPRSRRRTVVTVAVAFAAVLLIATIGFVVLRAEPDPLTVGPGPNPTDSSMASSLTDSASASPSPSPSPSAEPTTAPPAAPAENPVPTAPPTVAPPAAEQPPPLEPDPEPGCTEPWYEGENLPYAQVRDALAAAAGKQYWQGVVLPETYEGPLVPITVPTEFINAIAFQESGWQSAIMACDGGLGTMQLMPGTIDHVNQRFGMEYSTPLDLQENTEAGANYLQWLLMYFGLFYYGQNFDPFLEAPVGAGGQTLMLIDVVVAAYNVGPDAIENADNSLSIPNWDYVNSVWRFAMESCPCDAL